MRRRRRTNRKAPLRWTVLWPTTNANMDTTIPPPLSMQTFLAFVGSVSCLLRCVVREDGSVAIAADAGYRTNELPAPFVKIPQKVWRPKLPPFPDATLIRDSPDLVECVVPSWYLIVQSRSDLRQISVCNNARWRGCRLRPTAWPYEEEGGTRFHAFISDPDLPTQRLFNALAREGLSPTPQQRAERLDEFHAFARSLGPNWRIGDMGRDETVFGLVPVAECEYSLGELPEPWRNSLPAE